jgi:hypothetical protein
MGEANSVHKIHKAGFTAIFVPPRLNFDEHKANVAIFISLFEPRQGYNTLQQEAGPSAKPSGRRPLPLEMPGA